MCCKKAQGAQQMPRPVPSIRQDWLQRYCNTCHIVETWKQNTAVDLGMHLLSVTTCGNKQLVVSGNLQSFGFWCLWCLCGKLEADCNPSWGLGLPPPLHHAHPVPRRAHAHSLCLKGMLWKPGGPGTQKVCVPKMAQTGGNGGTHARKYSTSGLIPPGSNLELPQPVLGLAWHMLPVPDPLPHVWALPCTGTAHTPIPTIRPSTIGRCSLVHIWSTVHPKAWSQCPIV